MTGGRTPEEIAIWEGILKLVESLPAGRGGTSRQPGRFTKGYGDTAEAGPFERFSATTEFKQHDARGDGVADIYDIEITVTKRQSSNDAYWAEQLSHRQGALVINGKHYRIGKNNGRPRGVTDDFRGFGGRKFEIEMLANGHVAKVDDLWYQGPIPPKHLPLFPDNARFVRPEQEPFQ